MQPAYAPDPIEAIEEELERLGQELDAVSWDQLKKEDEGYILALIHAFQSILEMYWTQVVGRTLPGNQEMSSDEMMQEWFDRGFAQESDSDAELSVRPSPGGGAPPSKPPGGNLQLPMRVSTLKRHLERLYTAFHSYVLQFSPFEWHIEAGDFAKIRVTWRP